MNFSHLKYILTQKYHKESNTLFLDFNELQLFKLGHFFSDQNQSFPILVTLNHELDLDKEKDQFNFSGQVKLWNGGCKNLNFKAKKNDDDVVIEIVFEFDPQDLKEVFPDLEYSIYNELEFIKEQNLKLTYNSEEENKTDILCFNVEAPIDFSTLQWEYLNPVLNLDHANSVVKGTLKSNAGGMDLSLDLSEPKKIKILSSGELQVSTKLNINNYTSSFEALLEEEESVEELSFEFPGIQVIAKLNEDISFKATISTLQKGLVYLETEGALNLTDFSAFSWLIGEYNLKELLPESIQNTANLLIRKVHFAIDVSTPELISAEFEVAISGHEPITLISEHLKLDEIDLSFHINTPFNKENFSANATAKIELESALFNVSVAFPQLDFSIELSKYSVLSFGEIAKILPFDFPKLPELYFSELSFHGGIKKDSLLKFHSKIEDVWSIPIGKSSFNLNELEVIYYRDRGLNSGLLRGNMELLNFPFYLMASYGMGEDGLYLEGGIQEDKSIHLKDVIAHFTTLFHFTTPTDIPDITLDELSIGFGVKTKNFHLKAKASLHEKLGPINSGEFSVEIQLTSDPDTKEHLLQIFLKGELEIAHTKLDFEAKELGNKNWSLDLIWDKGTNDDLSLLELGKIFDPNFNPDENEDIQKVKRFLTLNHAEIHYSNGYTAEGDEKAKPTTFLIDARLDKDDKQTIEGLFAGINPNEDGKGWDFMIGLGYDDHSEIPDVGNKIPKEFKLDSIWCLVNTSTIEANHWPPLPASFPTSLTKQTAQKGIMAVAKMDLLQKDHKVSGLDNIINGLPNTTITLLAAISNDGLLIEAMLGGDLTIPTGQGHHITIEDVALIFKVKDLSASLAFKGIFQLELDDNPQNLQVELDVDEYGVAFLADDKIENNGWKPFGLESINIDELGFELGIDFEPPGARIGFEGKMHFDGQDKNAEQLAVVMEFVGPVPNPEYLALEIKQLKLDGLLELFPGSSKHGHEHIKGNIAQIEDFGLAWCEKPVVLPDGKTGKIGFSCHGAVEIFNWGAYVALEVHPQTGIQGFGELAPVKLGPLQIIGKGKGVSIKQNYVNGDWQNVSNIQINPDKKDKLSLVSLNAEKTPLPTRQHQIVEPGGAVIQFNSAGSPYLIFSANLNFFDLKIAEIDIEVAQDKLLFDLFLQIPLIATFKVHCNIDNGKTPAFDIKGDFFLGIHIKFDIPLIFATIHVDFQFGLEASIHIHKKDHEYTIELMGGINFMGAIIKLADLKIEGIPDSLAKLPSWIIYYIETGHAPKFKEHIEDGSGANNNDPYAIEKKQLATEMLVKAKDWAAYVHKDIQVLKAEKGLSIEEMNRLVDKIRADIQKIKEEDVKNKGKLEESISTNANQEIEHLKIVQNSVNEKVKDANEQREKAIDHMQWEIKWIKDESHILRNKIKKEWEKNELELVKAEFNIMELKKYNPNKNVTEETLEDAENTKEAVLKKIKDGVDALVSEEDPTKKYPQGAIDHHYFMIEQASKAHSLENEILATGKKHHHAILSELMNPSHLLKKVEPLTSK